MPAILTLEELTGAVGQLTDRVVANEKALAGYASEWHGIIQGHDTMRTEMERLRTEFGGVTAQFALIIQKQDETLAALKPLKALGSLEDAERIFANLAERQKTWREIMAKAREEAVQWVVRGTIGIFLLGLYQWLKQHSQ